MRYITLLITALFLLFRATAYGQTGESDFSKLYNGFISYYNIANTSPENDFIGRLMQTSEVSFSVNNKNFIKAVADFKKTTPGITNLQAAENIFDSVMLLFTRQHLWDREDPKKVEQFRPVLTFANNKICPCITANIPDNVDFFENFETQLKNCGTQLMFDTAYLNTIRRELGGFTMNEIQTLSQLGMQNMYAFCPLMYRKFSNTIKNISASAAGREIDNLPYTVGDEVIDLYKRKEWKELQDRFPLYRQFEKELMTASGFITGKGLQSLKDKQVDKSGKPTITITYYKYETDDKPVLKGQLLYTLAADESITTIVSLKYIKPENVTGAKKILNELAETEPGMPPPRIEELREVRIDTTKGN